MKTPYPPLNVVIERLERDRFKVEFTVTNEVINVSKGNVDISRLELKSLPKFGFIKGNFYCSHNELTSLEGVPKSVGGFFSCYKNNLTSLKGAPKSVGGDFNCSHNKLLSLKGSPESIGGWFVCNNNKLKSLEGVPESIGGYFVCSENKKKFTKKDLPFGTIIRQQFWG